MSGFLLKGYNIGSYATNPDHERLVSQVYDSIFLAAAKKSLQAHIDRVAYDAPVTSQMIMYAAGAHRVDPFLIAALIQVDSMYGTKGKGSRTHNPGNVGNDDTGKLVDYGTWEAGVDAVAKWLSKHKVDCTRG